MVLLICGMMVLWIMEGVLPFVALRYKTSKWRHASVNLYFTIIHLLIHTGFAFLIIIFSDRCKFLGFGLVNWIHASVTWSIIISFLVLDFFGGWLVHLVQHKTLLLWRFHIIHHSDNKVDVTTGLRHHPMESILRGIFFLLGVMFSGAPMYAVMIFQTLLVFSTQFTHANLLLPKYLEGALSYFFVSPGMHKVHHHRQLPYTDSNYGAVLSIWDRIFGTFKRLDPSQIKYGLDNYFPNEEDENFPLLMSKPFGKFK